MRDNEWPASVRVISFFFLQKYEDTITSICKSLLPSGSCPEFPPLWRRRESKRKWVVCICFTYVKFSEITAFGELLQFFRQRGKGGLRNAPLTTRNVPFCNSLALPCCGFHCLVPATGGGDNFWTFKRERSWISFYFLLHFARSDYPLRGDVAGTSSTLDFFEIAGAFMPRSVSLYIFYSAIQKHQLIFSPSVIHFFVVVVLLGTQASLCLVSFVKNQFPCGCLHSSWTFDNPGRVFC